MILTFIRPVLYSPNEPVNFFISWIRTDADPGPGGISLCGSGSETLELLLQSYSTQHTCKHTGSSIAYL